MNDRRISDLGKKVVIFGTISLLLITLDSLKVFNKLHEVVERSFLPSQQVVSRIVDLSETPARFFQVYLRGTAQIADLQARLAEYVVDKKELEQLRLENANLRQVIKTPTKTPVILIPARVISGNHERLLVNVGSSNGAITNANVVYEGVYVGSLTNVSAWISEVILATARDHNTAGVIFLTREEGIATGQGTYFEFRNVLQDVLVQPGQLVTTSGVDGVLPDLVVGRIVKVSGETSSSYQEIIMEPVLDNNKLIQVFIVKQG